MKWDTFRIFHSQKNMIDLYCRQVDEKLEIYITNAESNGLKILAHDMLIGKQTDLYQDQYLNEIKWVKTEINFEKYPCEFDMKIARESNNQIDNLDFLKYHIANAINRTYANRGFSSYLKKNIIGKWKENELALDFFEDGTYILTGKWKPSTTLAGVPEKGKYHLSRNMIHFWGNENFGKRIQLVDIVNNKIIFPGFSGKLFFTMTKE
jgi:hypothetical protein